MTWAGVVVDPGRTDGTVVGEPGGVREVDTVLGFTLSFSAVGGHAYSLLRATSLEGPWTAVEFQTSPGATPVNVISYPNSVGTVRPTVYLAPVGAPAAFFKVRRE